MVKGAVEVTPTFAAITMKAKQLAGLFIGLNNLNRHRFWKKRPLLITLFVMALVIAAYVFGLAYVQSHQYAFYEFDDLIQPRFIDVMIAGWLLFIYSSIGSFLNVVAWRMPRGEGIGGHSHCPRCVNRLKTRDNVPVLGWISLRGRCRFCSLPISRRYPIVEALVGITLTAVGIAQLYSLSLPGQTPHGHGGPLWAPRVTMTVLTILTYHTIALSTLWAFVLIRIDGTKLPRSLQWFAALVTIVPMLVHPIMMIVPWQANRPAPWLADRIHYDALMRIVTALVAAALFGRVLAKGLCPSADLKLDPLGRGTARLVDLIAMLSIPAILIGWQSMPALVIAAAILSFLLRPLLKTIPINDGPKGQIAQRGAYESFLFALPFALALHLVFWRVLWNTPYWPSDQSEPSVMIVAALLVLVVPLFVRESALPKGLVAESSNERISESADELPDDQGNGESDDGDASRDDAPSA